MAESDTSVKPSHLFQSATLWQKGIIHGWPSFKVCICPRQTWDLSISNLPVSWLQNTLQPIVTRYLKRWSGLSRSADPNRLFFPKSNGGLELSHLVTVYKRSMLLKLGPTCIRVIPPFGRSPPKTLSMRPKTPASSVLTSPGGGGGDEGRPCLWLISVSYTKWLQRKQMESGPTTLL